MSNNLGTLETYGFFTLWATIWRPESVDYFPWCFALRPPIKYPRENIAIRRDPYPCYQQVVVLVYSSSIWDASVVRNIDTGNKFLKCTRNSPIKMQTRKKEGIPFKDIGMLSLSLLPKGKSSGNKTTSKRIYEWTMTPSWTWLHHKFWKFYSCCLSSSYLFHNYSLPPFLFEIPFDNKVFQGTTG